MTDKIDVKEDGKYRIYLNGLPTGVFFNLEKDEQLTLKKMK